MCDDPTTRPHFSARRPQCLVTGGAAGLGFELARAFGEAGCDLVLVGDGLLELDLAAAELTGLVPDVDIFWVTADLTRGAGPVLLHKKLRSLERPIDILVANASVGAWGDFGRAASLEDELATAQVNTLSMLHLTRLVGHDMAERGQGQIVVASSETAGACTFGCVQGAARAFASVLARGLAAELGACGVGVTAFCPAIVRDASCARIEDPARLVEAAREVAASVAVARVRPKPPELLLEQDLQGGPDSFRWLLRETPSA